MAFRITMKTDDSNSNVACTFLTVRRLPQQMDRVWITNGSNKIAPVVNTLAAACHHEYIPTSIYVLDNPPIAHVTASAVSLAKTIVTAHGGEAPTIDVTTIENETDFDAIIAYLRSTIEAGEDGRSEIAIDVTPGRKFWSIISFRAGLKYEVDHLYYTHIETAEYFGESYPTIPRSVAELIDFTEVV